MKKSIFTLFALVMMVVISLAFTRSDPGYKNLKILPKNITAQQIDSVMEHFSKSLGVTCKFCHVGDEATDNWDFASDENKHKLVAREMMTMTDKINDKYFDITGFPAGTSIMIFLGFFREETISLRSMVPFTTVSFFAAASSLSALSCFRSKPMTANP